MDTTNDTSSNRKNFDPNTMRDARVAVVGAGELGASAVIALLQFGCRNVTAYDPDRLVELEYGHLDVPGEEPETGWYRSYDIRSRKIFLLHHLVRSVMKTEIAVRQWTFNAKDGETVVVIASEDQTQRRAAWDAIKARGGVTRLLDLRPGFGRSARLLVIDPTDAAHAAYYEASLEDATDFPIRTRQFVRRTVTTFLVSAWMFVEQGHPFHDVRFTCDPRSPAASELRHYSIT